MNYKIVTDSSSNLTDELIERFDLTVVPLTVITETSEYPSYVKGQKTDLKPFYDKLRAHEKISTSCANADAFRESFEQILQSGNDVLCVAFSSGLSATYNAAKMAADELSENILPERSESSTACPRLSAKAFSSITPRAQGTRQIAYGSGRLA